MCFYDEPTVIIMGWAWKAEELSFTSLFIFSVMLASL